MLTGCAQQRTQSARGRRAQCNVRCSSTAHPEARGQTMRHATSIRTLQVHNRNGHKVDAHVTHSVQCSSVQHKQCSAACSVLCNVWQCGAVQHEVHPNTPIATMLLQRNHATYATINAKPTAPQPQHRPYPLSAVSHAIQHKCVAVPSKYDASARMPACSPCRCKAYVRPARACTKQVRCNAVAAYHAKCNTRANGCNAYAVHMLCCMI